MEETKSIPSTFILNEEKLELLKTSYADPLFNSPILLEIWWSIWGESNNFKLQQICIKQNGKLVGWLPLYKDTFRYKKMFCINRLQFVGTNYQNIVTPRVEYIDMVVQQNSSIVIAEAIAELNKLKWDDFVIRDTLVGRGVSAAVLKEAKKRNWLVRKVHKDTAYSIDCRGKAQEYFRTRGKNTRLKIYNRRSFLATLGKIEFKNYYPDDVDGFFEIMRGYHERRWGDVFSSNTLMFHKKLIHDLVGAGATVSLSGMLINGVCESVVYDIQLYNKVYNIQSGYNENFHKKISLGSLHLGYSIEAAFENKTVENYDLLAGGGKNASYKKNLATAEVKLHSLQFVRSNRLKCLYLIKDMIQHIVRIFR